MKFIFVPNNNFSTNHGPPQSTDSGIQLARNLKTTILIMLISFKLMHTATPPYTDILYLVVTLSIKTFTFITGMSRTDLYLWLSNSILRKKSYKFLNSSNSKVSQSTLTCTRTFWSDFSMEVRIYIYSILITDLYLKLSH
jgi:hypothetical protein